MTPNRVARVTATVPTKPSTVGTAFAVARLEVAPGASARTLLLTARHVVYMGAEAPGTPVTIALDFPDATLVELGAPATFVATVVMDGAERAGGAPDPTDDWVVLEATLPAAVEPFPWGILDPEEVDRAVTDDRAVPCGGMGYPTGALNRFQRVRGAITGVIGTGTSAFLTMAVASSDGGNVDPAGFSGGPMSVGEVAVALFARSTALASGIVGKAEVAGTRRARPLQTIMARVAAKLAIPGAAPTLAALGAPRPVQLPPVDPVLEEVCLAVQELAADAVRAGTVDDLDDVCANVLTTTLADLPGGVVSKPHTLVLAVQRLLPGIARGAGAPLVRLLRALGAERQAIRDHLAPRLSELLDVATPAPPPPAPIAAAPSGLVLDVAWADPQDRKNARVTLRERVGGELRLRATQDAAADATSLLAACAALLQPRRSQLSEKRPLEVWAPFELAELAFDQAVLRNGEDEDDPIGALAPVTLRIRWPSPLDVPAEVVQGRAGALAALTVPLAALPGPMSEPPPDDPRGLLLDSAGADPKIWRLHARNRGNLLLVAIATPPAPGSPSKLAQAVLRGGVPVVAWERGSSEHLAALLRDGPNPLPLAQRLLRYRTSHPRAQLTVVLCPPGEPVPTDDLLSLPPASPE
jgi:hypothetical protein